MMKTYYLRDWKNKDTVYKWTMDGLSPEKENDVPEVTNGYINKFSFVGSIIAYRDGKEWRFVINGKNFIRSEISNVIVNKFGILLTLELIANGVKYKFKDISVWDYFSKSIDPTYDNMDSEEVFANWFLGVGNFNK